MKERIIKAGLFIAAAGVATLAVLGAGQLVSQIPRSLSDEVGLSFLQHQRMAPLRKSFLAQREASCQVLVEKRAQLIQLLKISPPDRVLIARLTDQIGREQTELERATLNHLLDLQEYLNPAQREEMTDRMLSQLRAACELTSCGKVSGCQTVNQRMVR